MAEEILNFEYNVILLVLKALNKFYDNQKAADALGCHYNMIPKYKRRFNISFDGQKSVYVSNSKILQKYKETV